MADNSTQQGNDTIMTDDVGGGVKVQVVKTAYGRDGAVILVEGGVGLPVKKLTDVQQNLQLPRFLTVNGDGTGTKDIITDYSGGEIFYIKPPAGVVYRITRLLWSVEDTNNSMRWDRFGGISALGDGIQLRVQNNAGTITDLTDGVKITTNAGWGAHAYNVELRIETAGSDFGHARWSFFKSEQIIRLDGAEDERLEAVVNDDFTGLVHQFIKVNGNIEGTAT